MPEIAKEVKIAEEKNESERIAALEKARTEQMNKQDIEFDKYSNWRFWVSRLNFPEKIVPPN